MAKRLSRRMSFHLDKKEQSSDNSEREEPDLTRINPREIKSQIESTEVVQNALEHDMAMMEKAYCQLKQRKQEEALERESENGLKERENAILVERLDKSYKVIKSFKADYISEDVEDVISALRRRVGVLQDEVAKSEAKYEALMQYQEEGNDDGEHGALEVLERAMKEKEWVVKLLNNLLVQKMTYSQSMEKIDGDLKGLKARRGMNKEVKAMMELKKKCKESIAAVDLKIAEVYKQESSCTGLLEDLYDRVEKVTRGLFENISYKGLMGWGKMKESKAEVGGEVVRTGLMRSGKLLEVDFKDRERRGEVK
eukprot:CAMPEP_0118637230 /NCGR_PEP_ID=MMETSP0785-20121206/3043_1 /TAXON_ID=91992 /ORGANISM="Bolidomonas pacifica, Strain CCMP 1866" /LENGTH=310 /DNA_ID=CAMNT_0006528405 /DNA_START=42 /DNA_END=971 /DNA_ORIENTATION=-